MSIVIMYEFIGWIYFEHFVFVFTLLLWGKQIVILLSCFYLTYNYAYGNEYHLAALGWWCGIVLMETKTKMSSFVWVIVTKACIVNETREAWRGILLCKKFHYFVKEVDNDEVLVCMVMV